MKTTIQFDKYYESLPSLLERYDNVSRQMAVDVSSKENYNIWKTNVRQKLMDISGISRMKQCSLNPEKLEVIQKDGYIQEKYIIQVEQGIYMPFYVLIPNDLKPNEKRPVVIAPHGHSSGGKLAVAGISEIPAIKDIIEHYDYSYGVDFVKQGYISICPDARGFGERRVPSRQTDDVDCFLGSSCHELTHMGLPLGLSVIGMWTYLRT